MSLGFILFGLAVVAVIAVVIWDYEQSWNELELDWDDEDI